MPTDYSVQNFCPIDDTANPVVQRELQTWPHDVRQLLRGTRQDRQFWKGSRPAEPQVPRGVLHAACVAALKLNVENSPAGVIPADMQDFAVLAQVIYDLACPKEISKYKLNQLAHTHAPWFAEFALNPKNLPVTRVGYREAIAQRDAANVPVVEAPAVEIVEADMQVPNVYSALQEYALVTGQDPIDVFGAFTSMFHPCSGMNFAGV